MVQRELNTKEERIMKKTLSAVAVLAFVFTAGSSFAGSAPVKADGCPDDCQQEIDALKSSKAQQDEQIRAYEAQVNQPAVVPAPEVFPWYVKGVAKMTMFNNLGTDPLDNSYSVGFDTASTGYGWGLALGKQFRQFRLEAQFDSNKTDLEDVRVSHFVSGRNFNVESGDIRLDTFMVNGFYDFPVADAWSLYVMGGMGYGNVELSLYDADGSESTFAYKLGAGASWLFAENQALDLGYEYLATSDVVIEGLDVNDIATHNIVLGYRYSFSF